MKRDLVRRLLLYIADQLLDMEAQISTIRLIKLLYLIDLEYYKRHEETLTGIDWIYYSYGPYFFAVGDILRSASIDLDAQEVLTSSGKGITFKSLEEQNISKLVDFTTEQQINRIIKNWALEETSKILDFVYNTPPIKLGKRGTPLDFNLALSKQEIKTENVFSVPHRLMLASESILAKEWDTPEEDEAWEYLSKKAK
jgi:antitoxin SocA-like protein